MNKFDVLAMICLVLMASADTTNILAWIGWIFICTIAFLVCAWFGAEGEHD